MVLKLPVFPVKVTGFEQGAEPPPLLEPPLELELDDELELEPPP